MGIITGILKRLIKLILYFALFATIILVIPNLPPYTKFSSIRPTPTKERTGALAPNSILNNVAKLYEGKLSGPENFQVYRNELYTSLATGEIVKISPSGHITFVTKIGQPCTGLIQEHICGRPLGFYIDEKNNMMYVADAYYGIWKVDLRTDKKQALVSADVVIDSKKPKLFNSVVVDKKGVVYWTASSSEYDLKDGVLATLADPAGRLFSHNPTTKENKVLIDNLWFANGLAISPDDTFVLVAETMKFRILKYYINGPKKGNSEIFVDGLPGTPDVIRVLPDGSGVQISLYIASDGEVPMLAHTLSNAPLARKFLVRLAHLIEMPFVFLNNQFPNPIFEEIIFFIGHFSSVTGLSDGTGIVITDWNGNIIASYYNTDKSVFHISDAIVFNDKLMLGCPHKQNFIGAVDIPSFLKEKYLYDAKETTKVEKPMEKVNREKPVKQEQIPKATNKPTEKTTTEKPQIKTTTEKPQIKTTTEKPQTKKTTEKPQVKTTTGSPQTKPVTEKPETKTTQKPETKTTSQKSQTNPTTEKPQTQPMTHAPKVTQPPSQVKKEQPKVVTPAQSATPKVAKETAKPKENAKVKAADANTKTQDNDKIVQENKQKQSDKTKTDSAKVTKAKDASVNKENVGKSKESAKENIKQNAIPIEEEIVSDTAKPSKDKLKVIKKSGPVEIPNPQL